MSIRRRRLLVAGGVVAILVVVWLLLARNCPSAGIALTSRARHLHRLKNRTALPQASDFDSRVTLDLVLQRGDDTNRWSTDHAGRLQGYVIDVEHARPEATNCFSPCRRDIHVLIANRKDAPKTEQVVLEVTPKVADWAVAQGIDWSEKTLQRDLVGHWVEFEGWLYFDVGHAEEAENTSPGRPDNWRGTAWEIHPITKITILR